MLSAKTTSKQAKTNDLCYTTSSLRLLSAKLVAQVAHLDVRSVMVTWLNAHSCLSFRRRRTFLLCVNWKVRLQRVMAPRRWRLFARARSRCSMLVFPSKGTCIHRKYFSKKSQVLKNALRCATFVVYGERSSHNLAIFRRTATRFAPLICCCASV
jgi:hypothetical protein